MKLVFIIASDELFEGVCMQIVSNFKYVVIRPELWLRQESTKKNSDLGAFIMINWSAATNEPLINQYVTECIAELPHYPEYCLIQNFPLTTFQISLIPYLSLGNPFVILSTVRNSDAKLPTGYYDIHTVKDAIDILSNDTQYKRVPIQTPPQRQLTSYAAVAYPHDAARVIQMTLRLSGSTRLRRQFCGTYPISLERKHISQLVHFPYLVSLKLDGTRMFVVTYNGRIWFVTRKMDVYEGPVIEGEDETLLDCEFCEENTSFYVCDCLCVRGKPVHELPLEQRLAATRQIGGRLPHMFKPQVFVPFMKLESLWESRHGRSCKIDGIVLTPANLPYRLGIDYKMFKWKEDNNNTVDLLFNNGRMHCRARLTHLEDVGVAVKSYIGQPQQGMIYECRTCGQQRWEIIKQRTDKPYPNLDWVVTNVLNSIVSKITINELIELSKQTSHPTDQHSALSSAQDQPKSLVLPDSTDMSHLLPPPILAKEQVAPANSRPQ